jgi:archaellum component FlaF (FlaF/FlaG flagellin family)
MGYGEIAATTILFISVLTASSFLAFALNNYVSEASSSIGTKQEYMNNQLRTDITIENVVYNSTGNNVRVFVRNTGESVMKVGHLSAYIANEWMNNNTNEVAIHVVSDSDTVNVGVWDPKEIIRIDANQSLASGITHKAIIITPYGIKDEYEFSV